MAEIQFFQLSEGPVAATVPVLLERALERGWKVVLRGPTQEAIEALDLALWQGQVGGIFRPHGLFGQPHQELQPVLLATEQQRDLLCDCLICFDRANLGVEELPQYARSVVIFDGRDEDALAHARLQWKALTGQGIPATYFAQEYGRWVKKAERA